MPRKPVLEGGTKDEIIKVATRLFSEKGFDSVTIRGIQREVGCEVGLFYYYFKSKEALFDTVLSEYSKNFTSGFEAAVHEVESPDEKLNAIFTYMHSALQSLRQYPLHPTTECFLQNRIFSASEEFIKNIISEISNEYDDKKSADLAVIVAHGVGSYLLNIDENILSDTLSDIIKQIYAVAGAAIEKKSTKKDIEVYLL